MNAQASSARRQLGTPADQRRRGLLAKVHIAKGQLGLAEDDYRDIVFQHCSSRSAGDATVEQLERLVKHFEQRGFTAKPKPFGGRRASVSDFPAAKKARALWISLHQLGAVRNPAEHALEAFAKRQLQVEYWRWSDQSMSYRLIEALKAMAKRHGWEVGDGSQIKLMASKARLNRAILVKLVEAGVAHKDWRIPDALFRLTGETVREIDLSVDIELQTRVAQLLGEALRQHAPTHNPEA